MKKSKFILALFLGLALIVACNSTPPEPVPTEPATAQPGPTQPAAPSQPGRIRDGIYVGIVTFGPDATDITGGQPIYLDADGLRSINSLLDSEYHTESAIGTALFYAAHMALANMSKAESNIPRNLGNVSMFTFTDGLDVSSTGLSLPPIDDPGNPRGLWFAGESIRRYEDFISQEINSRQINNMPIDAYVAAVRGDDVTNSIAFYEALMSLASQNDNIQQEVDMRLIEGMFSTIADTIVGGLTTMTFSLFTPEFPRGTRVRVTFNGENNTQEAQSAQLYLEGEITVQDNQYYFTNIRSGGGIVVLGGDVRGELERGGVRYNFSNYSVAGFSLNNSPDISTIPVRQWFMSPRGSEWQLNSEYTVGNEVDDRIVKHNALVYLVLDKSSSINETNLSRIRDSAKAFIRALYDVYYDVN